MGRKIRGCKHRGVRDPEVQKQVREAKLKGKINSAPIRPDEQEIPKKLLKISEYMSSAKRRGTNPKKPRLAGPQQPEKNVQRKKKKLLDSGAILEKRDGELGSKPLRNVPRFQQMPGESQYHFFRRVDKQVTDVIHRQSYEKKFNVEVSEDPVTGKSIIKSREKDEEELAKEEKRRKKIMKKKGIVIRSAEEKQELKRTRSKLRKLKKKGIKLPGASGGEEVDDSDNEELLVSGNEEGRLRDFSQLQDKVAFNEVAHAPPTITLKSNKKLNMSLEEPEARRPAAKEGLLVKAMLNGTTRNKKSKKEGQMTPVQKQILERERTRVIEQYRALKKMKHK